MSALARADLRLFELARSAARPPASDLVAAGALLGLAMGSAAR